MEEESIKQNLTSTDKSDKDSRLLAAIAYLPLLSPIIPILLLLIKKKDPFIKFHSIQSIAFTIVLMVGGLLISFTSSIFALVTLGIGLLLILPILFVLGVIVVIAYLLLIYKAYKGEKFMLPFIGKWAASFK